MSDSDRRIFLGALAASAAAFSISTCADAMLPPAGAEPRPESADNTSFETWLNKVKGVHRQVFDAPGEHEGMPLAWSRVFLMSNKMVGVSDEDVTAVLILRHSAIPIAMNSDLWAKYKFGEVFKITDKATSAPAERNPYSHPKPGELLLPDMNVEALLASGVLIGLCDMALTVYSGAVGKAMSMDPAAVKKDWIAGVVPGVQLVPSGVLAVNRAQEHRCTYCYAG